MSVSQVSNVAGAFGQTAQPDWVVEEHISGESSTTIAKGNGVQMTTVSNKVLQVTTATLTRHQLIGVAPAAIAAGAQGLVMVKGNMQDIAIADYASPTVGDLLTIPATTAGRLGSLALATLSIGSFIGVVAQTRAQAAGATVADCYISKF